eukprot:s3978_g2.t1
MVSGLLRKHASGAPGGQKGKRLRTTYSPPAWIRIHLWDSMLGRRPSQLLVPFVRRGRGSIQRPPGAFAGPVPSDDLAEAAPEQAVRRAGEGSLPRWAFSVPRTARVKWQSTNVQGDKIYYRQWSYTKEAPESQVCGGFAKRHNRSRMTASEERQMRPRRSDSLSVEELKRLALDADKFRKRRDSSAESQIEIKEYES